jgi:hypothetical protein
MPVSSSNSFARDFNFLFFSSCVSISTNLCVCVSIYFYNANSLFSICVMLQFKLRIILLT